ncbi:HNRNP arginine N-methyltransferase [Pseudovirgaria hyperparasitica]|uniref:type I protein arginine methyltransferase n=1 Tax=Pseudovirgaria hyperparasitica TaxID=470096 RepID=A0A6A6W6Z3_9PEZI|nr:HNRNP arginine N-methyltransferase [Pseudovirgaria hyperparasitica]KAF2757794.1 HNRNP arginine N-methyltransferase [Pseudovirgaria hyperparasitica]
MAALTPSESDSSSTDPREDEESEGYEDVEPDNEDIEVIGLFDNQTYPDAKTMLNTCKDKFGFDFAGTQKSLDTLGSDGQLIAAGLDFYDSIKLVNFIRSEVKKGNLKPDASTKDRFSGEEYLQPVLENDTLLFSLDDLPAADGSDSSGSLSATKSGDDVVLRVQELEDQLNRLGLEYQEYRTMVAKTLDDRWNSDAPGLASQVKNTEKSKTEEEDKGYFASYGQNDIHETMIKDKVRTEAYRDFIYKHKHIFEGKVVLDIGCGSGILSLFCAKAGAAKVIAVDNSNIIEKTRLVVHASAFDDKITCVRGKIEEVTLPVSKVDIIVSEWMGYALLYEAMLDSVLWARDKYLKPDGLMVPSHCTLHIAPVVEDVVLKEKMKFWRQVYDFDLTPMMNVEGTARPVVEIMYHEPKEIGARSYEFLQLPLHTITASELSFVKEFRLEIDQDIDSLGGWLIWFDAFFLESRNEELPRDARAATWTSEGRRGVAFTTGPEGTKTHWECAFLSTQAKKMPGIVKGGVVSGVVEYRKPNPDSRSLDIRIRWNAGKDGGEAEMVWTMGIDG